MLQHRLLVMQQTTTVNRGTQEKNATANGNQSVSAKVRVEQQTTTVNRGTQKNSATANGNQPMTKTQFERHWESQHVMF